MIKHITKIIILCIATVSYAQETEIIDGLFNPLGLALNNDELFICEHAANNIGQGKISKINLTEANPVKTELITDILYPRALCLYGNDLYYSKGTLYKFDITDANPVAEEVMYVGTTFSLIEIDDFLYIGGNYSIYKIDLTSPNPSLISVIDNLADRPLAFEYREGFLYFGYGTKVAKIDPTQANPVPELVVENLPSNIYSLIFYEDTLLIGMSIAAKISKVDFNQQPLVAEDFLDTTLGSPAFFSIWNDDLYVAGGIGGTIFRIENLSSLLSLDDHKPFLAISMYPNPSSEKIHVQGLQNSYNFEIFNSNGQHVMNGKRNPSEDININNLASGMYYINLSDGISKAQVLKFIKK